MNVWTINILIVIVWTTSISADSEQSEDSLYCGPLKDRISEYKTCYDSKSAAEIPCPNKPKDGTQILKFCRPTYAIGGDGDQILNRTYRCDGNDYWAPNYDGCQTDCGQPRPNNKHPWLVAIYDGEEALKCTGTIISAAHVLTVGSCFDFDYDYIVDISNLTIVAGKHYSNIHRKKESAQIRKIKKVTADTVIKDKDGIILFEVDRWFDFFEDVQPACIDWSNYYEQKDFSEGNEAVAVGWDYKTDEMVPCEDQNEFNVQFWHFSTCVENIKTFLYKYAGEYRFFCGTYINGNRSSCGKSIGAGLFFKSSPWRYYLRGITVKIVTQPEVIHTIYATVSSAMTWLHEEMRYHLAVRRYLHEFFNTRDKYFPKRKTGCILPERIKYGRFRLVFGETYRPGAWVSTDTRILLFCTANSDGTPTSTRCNLGEWEPPIAKLKCKRPGTCSALPSSSSEDVFCRLNGQEVSCVEPVNNTTAIIRCKPFHAISGNKPIYKCEDGLWDQPFARCILECGTKRVGVSTLSIGGSEVIENEYPWVVGVYRLSEQICGGTIISKSYVLSAAHCFTTSTGTALDKKLYTILAGKHYRNSTVEEPSAQSRNIKTLYIHGDYKGSLQKHRDDIALIELDAELTPSLTVQPACVDWDNLYEDFDLVDGNNGVVAGWGYTENGSPSEELKKIVLPYRPKDVCMANLPKDFSHQYVATDKICAGYEDKNINVCRGDSGGGLYFRSADNHFYVRGIVSLTVRTQVGPCQGNNFALYTKVSKYLPWLEAITRRVL